MTHGKHLKFSTETSTGVAEEEHVGQESSGGEVGVVAVTERDDERGLGK